MFKGVTGSGIKKFFQNRGRKLNFGKKQAVKVEAGVKLESLAKDVVAKNVDNIMIASLEAKIETLKIQIAASPKDKKLKEELAWAEEYLTKFKEEVKKVRTAMPPAQDPEEKKQHELKTLLKNIGLQRENALKALTRIPFLAKIEKYPELETNIKNIEEYIKLYNQSVTAYTKKGGKDPVEKITLSQKQLTTVYKVLAQEIYDLKDAQLQPSADKNTIKARIVFLEKFTDSLVRFAESETLFNSIKTEVDKKLAEDQDKKRNAGQGKKGPGQTQQNPPVPPKPTNIEEIKKLIQAYKVVVAEANQIIDKMNAHVKTIEAIANKLDLGEVEMLELIALEKELKELGQQVDKKKTKLADIKQEAKTKFVIELETYPEIQAATIKSLQYSMDYKMYIESLDRKSLQIVVEIQKLESMKTNASTEEIEQIDKKTKQLYATLLAINTLIEKRIVQYSKTNNIPVIDLYKARKDKKAELAKDYAIADVKVTPVPTEGKTESEILEARVNKLSERWLEAIKKAKMDRAGRIVLDETSYVNEMTHIIAHAHTESEYQIITNISDRFNTTRNNIIKTKRAKLDEFRTTITRRIKMIFSSGTISERIEKDVDHNEWLSEIEFNQMLILAGEYREYFPNGEELIQAYVDDQEKIYQSIKKKQQLDIIRELSSEFAMLTSKIDKIPVDENFEITVMSIFEEMRVKYKKLKGFDLKVNMEENFVEVTYNARKYNFSTAEYQIVPQEFPHVIMSQAKLAEYKAKKNQVVEPKKGEEPQQEEDLTGPKIVFKGEEESEIKVTNRTIKLATNRRQVINRAKNLIIENADPITVSLIKQGLRIKYNENLRNQLKALNARLHLVHKDKDKYRTRKIIDFEGDETEKDLAFKTPKEDFKIEDYKLEFRLMDDARKRSDLLYSYDLENISEELHRSK